MLTTPLLWRAASDMLMGTQVSDPRIGQSIPDIPDDGEGDAAWMAASDDLTDADGIGFFVSFCYKTFAVFLIICLT